MSSVSDDQEIKVLVVLDAEPIERFNLNFEGNELTELLIEAETGSIRLAIADVQKSELEAHLNEQLAHVKSVARNLVGGAGKKRIAAPGATSEADGVHLPRLLANGAVVAAINEIVTAAGTLKGELANFFATKNLEVISTEHIPAGRVLAAYFGGKPPFGLGRKKHEFPDAISIAAITDLAAGLVDGTEVHVISGDGDWARAFESHESIRFHRTVGEALQYLRKLEAVANDFEQLVVGKDTPLNEAIAEAFENLEFAESDHWDADVDDVTVHGVDVEYIVVTKSVNRVLTVDVDCTIRFSCVVTYTEHEYAPAVSARLSLSSDFTGTATATMTPTFDSVGQATFSFAEKVVTVSFDEADEVAEVFDDEPDDEEENENGQ